MYILIHNICFGASISSYQVFGQSFGTYRANGNIEGEVLDWNLRFKLYKPNIVSLLQDKSFF
jgi:hypothetical protein